MPNKGSKGQTLEELIVEVNEVLNEIKKEQINMQKMIEQNHKVNMRKFQKLITYTEISDMTNQIFERRISSIEKLLYEVFKS